MAATGEFRKAYLSERQATQIPSDCNQALKIYEGHLDLDQDLAIRILYQLAKACGIKNFATYKKADLYRKVKQVLQERKGQLPTAVPSLGQVKQLQPKKFKSQVKAERVPSTCKDALQAEDYLEIIRQGRQAEISIRELKAIAKACRLPYGNKSKAQLFALVQSHLLQQTFLPMGVEVELPE